MNASNYTTSEYRKGHAFEDLMWPVVLHLLHRLGAQPRWVAWASAVTNQPGSRLVFELGRDPALGSNWLNSWQGSRSNCGAPSRFKCQCE